MDNREKEIVKEKLSDPEYRFSESELHQIIDREFFDDSTEADFDLIDLAVKRLALLNGISVEEQINGTRSNAKILFFAQIKTSWHCVLYQLGIFSVSLILQSDWKSKYHPSNQHDIYVRE